MDDNKLLKKIGSLIGNELRPIKKQLDTVEIKVELVNKRVGQIEEKVEQVSKKIEQSQEETIEVLSELINTGYNLHEERIKNAEEALRITNPQQ